jgi:hypothetical protein
MPLDDALRQAMQDLNDLDDPFASEMNIVALDREGEPAAASTAEGKTFVVMTEDMAVPDERPRLWMPLNP